MIRPQPRRKPDKLSQTLGVLLILVGLAYVALLAFVLTSVPVPQFELRAGQAKEVWEFLLVVVFMLGFGALLLWIGYTYLRPETERPESVDEKTTMLLPNPNYLLVKYRRVVEVIAASGCGLMLAHSMALFKGAIWPSLTALWILTFTPAVISIVVMRILVPFQPGQMENDLPPRIRLVAKVIYQIVSIGYLPVPLALLDLDAHIFEKWRPVPQITTSSLISLLYASQVLALHFGRVKEAVRGVSDEP